MLGKHSLLGFRLGLHRNRLLKRLRTRLSNGLLANTPVPGFERNIEFEYVHARLAQESPLPVLRVLKNQARDVRFWNLAFRRHAANLKLRRRGRNVRIEP
jgi:hypothetical protein